MNQSDQAPKLKGVLTLCLRGTLFMYSITLQGHFASWFESAYGDIDESSTKIAFEMRAQYKFFA